MIIEFVLLIDNLRRGYCCQKRMEWREHSSGVLNVEAVAYDEVLESAHEREVQSWMLECPTKDDIFEALNI